MAVIDQYNTLIKTLGEAALHSLYPKDFAYYAMSLELVQISGEEEKTIDYFVFPVMPNQYSHSLHNLTNVQKTSSGVLSVKTSDFIPREIKINGDFGSKFKLMIGQSHVHASAWRFSTAGGSYGGGNLQIKFKPFDIGIKNGYGALKILEGILNKSSELDDKGYPYILYFYNPSMGESFVVECINLTLNQEVNRARIHSYNLQLKALAPIVPKKDFKSFWKTAGIQAITNGVNATANLIRKEYL